MSQVLSAGFNTAGLLRVYQRFESLKGKEWNPKKINLRTAAVVLQNRMI